MAERRILLATVAATHFRGTLAQHAAAELNLDVKSAGLGLHAECRIKAVRIVSVQQLSWEVWLCGRATFTHLTNPDADSFLGSWTFVQQSGLQRGGAGLYHYYVDGNDIEYLDADNTSTLHLVLINRSSGGKLADDAGAVKIEFEVEEGT